MPSHPNQPLQYIDSHCHLDFAQLADTAQIIRAAATVGVTSFVVPSVSVNNWRTVLNLAQSFPQIYPALGIHPYFLKSHTDNQISTLYQLAHEHRANIVAIGEIGLDGAIATSLNEQLEVLIPQLTLAKDLELPVICHAHKAYDPLLKQLRRFKLTRGGVVHGFSGSAVQANEFIKLGFKLGIGGVITYPRANKIRTLVGQLDLHHMVLETDAPDMPLCGQQGQVNTPANIPTIAKVVSELTSIDLATVATRTTSNCHEMFLLQM